MTIRFDDQVAVVTGGGRGLGRSYALALAERGAKVVVVDLPRGDGADSDRDPAQSVVDEIVAAGGEAMSSHADVTAMEQVAAMTDAAVDKWGRVDVLVNNAGILRDKSFAKMTPEEFRLVVDVHLFGTFNCCHAAWPRMREQRYGRIVNAISASGLYGNFGQSNYSAAKMGIVGLMNTLHHEGQKYDIRVNCLAPVAATRMSEGLLGEREAELMDPALVAPGLVYLASENAPRKTILNAGCGRFSRTFVYESSGIELMPPQDTAEDIEERWAEISLADDLCAPDSAYDHVGRIVALRAGS